MICVSLSSSKRAHLKLVGSVTSSSLALPSGGRIACGSGLLSVIFFGSTESQTRGSV